LRNPNIFEGTTISLQATTILKIETGSWKMFIARKEGSAANSGLCKSWARAMAVQL
jgi:hypothetical protein